MKSGKKNIAIAAVIVLAIIGIAYYVKTAGSNGPMTRYDWDGTPVSFRADLRQAQNVSAYPDEKSIYNEIWNPGVYRVKIAYVSTENVSSENGMLAAEAFEVRFKLDLAYKKHNWENEFSTLESKSFDNLSSANDTMIVAIYRPSQSDRTGVELNGNIVSIKGTTQQDLDLATMKFLMIAMNITV